MAEEKKTFRIEYPTPKGLPSYFTSADKSLLEARQSSLEGYRKRAGEYDWGEKPWYERWGREALAAAPFEMLPIDWFKYGVTPGETQELAYGVSEDIDELLRKQRVTRQAQEIMNALQMLRSAGVPITTPGELEGLFTSMGGSDWTEEDRRWVLESGMELLGLEEGKAPPIIPGMLPEDLFITPEQAEVYYQRTGQERDFIASTVAWSKDIAEVTAALREMYRPLEAPKVTDKDTLTDLIKAKIEAEGFSYDDTKSVEENLESYVKAGGSYNPEASVEENLVIDQVKEQFGDFPYDNTLSIKENEAMYIDFISLETEEEQAAWLRIYKHDFYLSLLPTWAKALEKIVDAFDVVDTPFMLEYDAENLMKKIAFEDYIPTEKQQVFLNTYTAERGNPPIMSGQVLSKEFNIMSPFWTWFIMWGQTDRTPSRELVAAYHDANTWYGEIADSLVTPLSFALIACGLTGTGVRGFLATRYAKPVMAAVKVGDEAKLMRFVFQAGVKGQTAKTVFRLLKPAEMFERGIGYVPNKIFTKAVTNRALNRLNPVMEKILGGEVSEQALKDLAFINKAIVNSIKAKALTGLTPDQQLGMYTGAVYKYLSKNFGRAFADKYAPEYSKRMVRLIEEETIKVADGSVLKEAINTLDLPENTKVSLENLANKIASEGLTKEDITAEWIAKNLPEGVAIEKNKALIKALEDLGVSSEWVKGASVDDAMTKFVGENVIPEPIKVPTTPTAEMGTVERRLARTKITQQFPDITQIPAGRGKVVSEAMPQATQRNILAMAGTGKPGLSTETMGIIYRSPSGEPIAVVTLHPEASGAIRVGSVVVTGEGLLKGKAASAILAELKRTPNLVFPPVSEMSPEGLKLAGKLGVTPKVVPEVVIPPDIPIPFEESGYFAKAPGIGASMGARLKHVATQKYAEMFIGRELKELGDDVSRMAFDAYTHADYGFKLAGAQSKAEISKITTNPIYRKLISNEASMNRIEQEILARNDYIVKMLEKEGISLTHPELTASERGLADAIAASLKSFEPTARFMRFTELAESIKTVKGIIAKMPDAVGHEEIIEEALRLFKEGKLSELARLIEHENWGVISNGYVPLQAYFARVENYADRLLSETGYGLLQSRTGTILPAQAKGLWSRYTGYVRSINMRFETREAQKMYNDLFGIMDAAQRAGKLRNVNVPDSQAMIKSFWKELMQRTEPKFLPTQIAYNVVGQAYNVIFQTLPWLPVRNTVQFLVLHPDKLSLLKYVNRPRPEWWKIYRGVFVDEMGGIQQDQMLMRETRSLFTGKLEFLKYNPFSMASKAAQRINAYGWSDRVGRFISADTSMFKALDANEKFLSIPWEKRTMKDFNNWLRNSGAAHYEIEERMQFFSLLSQREVSMGYPGMEHLTGAQAAAAKIGNCGADITHFRYMRWARAAYEHGTHGKLIWNLTTFPRSVFERFILQAKKVTDTSLPMASRLDGLKDIMNICVMGTIMTGLLHQATGKKTKAYNPLHMFEWTAGGLVMGVLIDASEMMMNLYTAVLGDAESQDRALGQLPFQITRMADVFIPWYSTTLSLLEGIADKKYMDTQFLRQVRAKFDKNYNAQDIETANRTLLEAFQHGAFGSEPDRTVVEKMELNLSEAEKKLGTLTDKGELYDLPAFRTEANRYIKQLPTDMVSEEFGYSELVCFIVDCQAYLEEYYYEPYEEYEAYFKGKGRAQMRLENPNIDAMLYFWGDIDDLSTVEARGIVDSLYDYYLIPHVARR